MRKDQCLFCTSRRCHKRIVTADGLYDEIACWKHSRDLDGHAFKYINNGHWAVILSIAPAKRGTGIPDHLFKFERKEIR